MPDCKDTGYFYLFFNGSSSLVKGCVPVIIENPITPTKPLKLHIDYNGNFNFTDDGQGVQLPRTFRYADVILHNQKGGKTMVRLSRMSIKGYEGYYTLQNQYYQNTYPERLFLGLFASFRAQTFRVRKADCIFGQDSFQIGLHDGNTNGNYTESEEDELVFANKGDSVFSTTIEDGAMALTGKSEYTFERRGRKYSLKVVPSGDTLEVTQQQANQTVFSLAVGSRFPKFSYQNTRREKTATKKLRFKKALIYFFDFKSPTLEADTTALSAIVSRYGKKIKVIGLYYGPYPEFLKNYIQYGHIKWTAAYASKEILNRCKVEQVPTTYYLKRWRKVKLSNTSPAEVLRLLESGGL